MSLIRYIPRYSALKVTTVSLKQLDRYVVMELWKRARNVTRVTRRRIVVKTVNSPADLSVR